MNADTRDPLRLILSGLEKLGHSPGAIDGLWGLRTVRAMKALLAANGRAASVAPPGPLPWITEAKSALGRHEARDRSWLMDWLKRDGRSLGDPAKNPWCGDFMETCIRMALPGEPLLGALGTNPYWPGTGSSLAARSSRSPAPSWFSNADRAAMSVSPSARTTRISTCSEATSLTPSPLPASPSLASLARAGPRPSRPACSACQP